VDAFRVIELRAQYEVLSQIEDMFSPTSKHRVAKYVDKKMREIIKELETFKKQENCTFCEGTGQIVSSTTISRFKTCDCIIIPQEELK
jgi:hypothetical protein